jgi:hypothetical protein
MARVIEYKDFYANCNHMPGAKRALRVGGTAVCPTSGWTATLRAHERTGPPPVSALTLELDLVLEEPEFGNDIVTPVQADEYLIEDPTIDYHDVYIFGDDERGDGPGQVVVVHTQ